MDEAKRTDRYSRIIKASPEKIFDAYTDVKSIATWRPPKGMTCHVYSFEPRKGGYFRMAFEYKATDHPVAGKTTAHADFFHGTFLELVPGKKIVELIEFESDDPVFAEPMKCTTLLTPVEGGTEVSLIFENVPAAISEEDHQLGMQSSLQNLAEFTG